MNIYPSLSGLTFPVKRTPTFTNIIQKTANGRRVGASYMQYPLFSFSLSYDYLSVSDLQQLEAFFIQQGGDRIGFYFDSGPGDDAVTAQGFGSGDGTSTEFQLYQSNLGYSLPVDATFGARTAYVAGTSASATFESPNPGMVTFASAPANGTALTWTGSYYYLCTFKNSMTEFDEFAHLLYNAQQVDLETYKL